MTINKTMADFSEVLKKADIVSIVGIVEENHKPHIFNVDSQHTQYAKDAHAGIMDEDVLAMFPCGLEGCKLNYKDHSYERKLMLQIKQDLTQAKAQEELVKIKHLFKEHGVFRVAFVEGEGDQKFKFI